MTDHSQKTKKPDLLEQLLEDQQLLQTTELSGSTQRSFQEPKDAEAKLQVLTNKQIEAYQIPKESLWYVQVGKETVGPYHKNHLKAYIDLHPEFPFDVKVANAQDKKWLPLFKVVEFQRRKQNVVSKEEWKKNKHFYLLKKGQRSGPYTLEQIQKKLWEKDLLLTDLLSFDEGENWIKILEHPQFDRRARSFSFKLPESVPEELLHQGHDDVVTHIKQKFMQNQASEGLFGLAFMERHKLHSPGRPQDLWGVDHILSSESTSVQKDESSTTSVDGEHRASRPRIETPKESELSLLKVQSWQELGVSLMTKLIDKIKEGRFLFQLPTWTYASVFLLVMAVGSYWVYQKRNHQQQMAEQFPLSSSSAQRQPASIPEESPPPVQLKDKKNRLRKGKILYQEVTPP
jgi:hypothetical protein